MFTIDDLLEIAVKMEENGESVYMSAIKNLEDEDQKNLMEWMAKEEEAHAQWFRDLKNNFTLTQEESSLKKMVPQALQDMMGDRTLSLEEVDFSKFKTTRELFQTFIGFEKDTIAFYELLEMFIESSEALDGLKQIILEEKNHIQILENKMSE